MKRILATAVAAVTGVALVGVAAPAMAGKGENTNAKTSINVGRVLDVGTIRAGGGANADSSRSDSGLSVDLGILDGDGITTGITATSDGQASSSDRDNTSTITVGSLLDVESNRTATSTATGTGTGTNADNSRSNSGLTVDLGGILGGNGASTGIIATSDSRGQNSTVSVGSLLDVETNRTAGEAGGDRGLTVDLGGILGGGRTSTTATATSDSRSNTTISLGGLLGR